MYVKIFLNKISIHEFVGELLEMQFRHLLVMKTPYQAENRTRTFNLVVSNSKKNHPLISHCATNALHKH